MQYLHQQQQQQQQQFAYVAKNYPKQKNAKKLPRTTICKFWERSDFAKDSSAAKKICKRKLKIWNDHLQNFAKQMAGEDKMQNQSDHDHKII